MNKYIVVNILNNRQIGCMFAKSLRSAQCLSPRLFGYDSFNRVREVLSGNK